MASAYPIVIAQEPALKHFIVHVQNISINDAYWITEAENNHKERGAFSPTNTNTSMLVDRTVWDKLVNSTYFEPRDSQPVQNAQLALTIEKEDILRVITTKKRGRDYDVDEDKTDAQVEDQTFLFTFNNGKWNMVHRET